MQDRKDIGLAIVGCGTIGRIRAELARAYPGIGWIGLCGLKSDIGQRLAEDVDADFFTTDFRELLRRPEVTRRAPSITTKGTANIRKVPIH